MCLQCKPLLKAIDAYLARADDDLADALGEEGYVEPKKTLKYAQDIEDGVADALLEETDFIVAEAEKAVDLETFAADVWPEVKIQDGLKEKLVTVFTENFTKFMPEFTGYYLAQTDRSLKLAQVSKRTTAWVSEWSQDLGAIMKLNSHTEIEGILRRGLEDGSGIAEFTRQILDSGIRDEYYKARRVAVTEVLRAHSVAQQEAFMQSPSVSEKMWKHTGAYRNVPRQNHVDMDGQRVPKNAPFILIGIKGGTYEVMYPRDTILPPEESINCHCICQPVVDEDVLGMSLEERQKLQQQAIDEMDDEWEKELDARNRAKAGIDQDGGSAATGSGTALNGDKYSRYPEKLGGVERGAEMTFTEADNRAANPGYRKGTGTAQNCQSCVVAHEARMRGYDVEARSYTKNKTAEMLSRDTRIAWVDPETGDVPEFEPWDYDTTYTPSSYGDYLEERVKAGGRYTLEFSWKNAQGGHIISVDRDDGGSLRLYDPQTGKQYVKDFEKRELLARMSYTSRYGRADPPHLLRVDNLSFREDVVQDIVTEERAGWKRKLPSETTTEEDDWMPF